MLYWLSDFVKELGFIAPFRLMQSITFRTLFAMMTAFFIAILVGRSLINWLYVRKIRDTVRDYSVMSVESKKGTPTMGGLLILLALFLTLVLWSDWTNPYLYFLIFPLLWFAAIGGMDDYLKIRNKDSDKGLSRKAKYLGQIGFALLFGFFYLHPQTTPAPHPNKKGFCKAVWDSNCSKTCKNTQDCHSKACGNKQSICLQGVCTIEPSKKPIATQICDENQQCASGFGKGSQCIQHWKLSFGKNTTNFTPSQLYLPFYKWPLLDLSWLYLLIIIFFIVFSANAVNFADGLDGLTTGPTLFSYLVYGIYSYVLGNVVWSKFLLFPYLPGVGEITVFAGAMVGALIGFLWYNSYPADVFMGDTGSLMLGGVLGSMMVLLKQEVLFFLLGGIFLVEILSVVVQDWVGIQIIGKRLLFRAPIHHTFQHRGMSEPKIVIRFWIVAGILAIIALAALKIR